MIAITYKNGVCTTCNKHEAWCECELTEYTYRGQTLTNVKEISGLNYLGHDIEADWFNPASGRLQHGFFYMKDLEMV